MSANELNSNDWQLILACVDACTPIGGGSTQNNLGVKLRRVIPNIQVDDRLAGTMQGIAHSEYEIHRRNG